MVSRKRLANGVRFSANPFSAPNHNSACIVTGEVTRNRIGQRSVHFTVENLVSMTLSDVIIFHAALLAVKAQVQAYMAKSPPAKRKKR